MGIRVNKAMTILVTIIFASEIIEVIPIKKCRQPREYKLVLKHIQAF